MTQDAGPVGVTRSGAVVIADGRALWSLSSGRLTRVCDYVLHLYDGAAALMLSAKPTASNAKSGTCDVHDPVDATRFPCALPSTLTYHAGQLVLAGEKSYVVRLPASQG